MDGGEIFTAVQHPIRKKYLFTDSAKSGKGIN